MSSLNIKYFSDSPRVVAALSQFVVEAIQRSVLDFGRCRIALAGGSTPQNLYQSLASPEFVEGVDWSAVHLFWGDERCVSPEDPDSNYGMAKNVLLERANIPKENIHPIDGTLDPAVGAKQYADLIGDEPLDLILLGLGQDGHTASLFSHTPNLLNEPRAVVATESPLPPTERISLSLKTINAARQVAFLILGSGKSEVLARVLAERDVPNPKLPGAMVCPIDGDLFWFVDQDAASKLEQVLTDGHSGDC